MVVAAVSAAAMSARQSLADREAEEQKWWSERGRPFGVALSAVHYLGWVLAVMAVWSAMPAAVVDSAVYFIGLAVVMTGVLFALVDVLPRVLGRRYADSLGRWALGAIRLPTWVMRPFSLAVMAIRKWSNTEGVIFQSEVEGDGDEHRGLRQWLKRELSEGNQRQRMIHNLLEFPTTVVREVMVPRTDMVVVSRDMPLEKILVVLIDCGHSRIPVIGESLDAIEGVFYAKDVIELMESGDEFEIDRFIRPAYFVPETRSISELLTEFQKERVHLAVVVDEFGGTAGLITLEDIIEEFFGDIQDEYDVEPAQLVSVSGGAALVDARIPLEEIEDHFSVEFPEDDDFDSLGGFLLDQLGGVPEPGDELSWEGLDFCVIQSTKKRIETVSIEEKSDDSVE